jgi:hypothetical protein
MAMFPPVFSTLFASTAVKALLGSAPLRVYPAGEAPQDVAKPYATYQTISGVPENYLGTLADMDGYTIQIDIYATTLSSVRAVADAVRTALEDVAYITSLREPPRDSPTNNFRYSMDVDFFTAR